MSREATSFGVLGGLGPLTSARFVETIYRCYPTGTKEQDMARVLLWCDPTFPDRTEALLAGNGAALAQRAASCLERMFALGVTRATICCFTISTRLSRSTLWTANEMPIAFAGMTSD